MATMTIIQHKIPIDDTQIYVEFIKGFNRSHPAAVFYLLEVWNLLENYTPERRKEVAAELKQKAQASGIFISKPLITETLKYQYEGHEGKSPAHELALHMIEFIQKTLTPNGEGKF